MPTKTKERRKKDMKFSKETILETLKAFVQKERSLYDEEGIVVGVIVLEGDTQLEIERNKKLVYDLASHSFGFYELHQKVMDEHINKNLVDEVDITSSRMINYANHFAQYKSYINKEVAPGVRVDYINLGDSLYNVLNAIESANDFFHYDFNHIYCFAYIYNRTGETDEYVYPIHLVSAIKELLMTGTVRDEEVFI